MAAPDFSPATVDMLAYRSAYICNNPECHTLTIGPSSAVGDLKIKVGEAAHICGKKDKTARYDRLMTDEQRAAIQNGIWLCASCHTLVDKNNGTDFKESVLREWKKSHEELISVLLRTHRSPLPLIRRQSTNHTLAQEAVDTVSGRGAFFMDQSWEDATYVIRSVEQTKRRVERLRSKIELDERLRAILWQLIDALRQFMNETSTSRHSLWGHLQVLRRRVGIALGSLRDEYGCRIPGTLASMIA